MTTFDTEPCTRPSGEHGPLALLIQSIGDVEISMSYCGHCSEPLAGGVACGTPTGDPMRILQEVA